MKSHADDLASAESWLDVYDRMLAKIAEYGTEVLRDCEKSFGKRSILTLMAHNGPTLCQGSLLHDNAETCGRGLLAGIIYMWHPEIGDDRRPLTSLLVGALRAIDGDDAPTNTLRQLAIEIAHDFDIIPGEMDRLALGVFFCVFNRDDSADLRRALAVLDQKAGRFAQSTAWIAEMLSVMYFSEFRRFHEERTLKRSIQLGQLALELGSDDVDVEALIQCQRWRLDELSRLDRE